MMKTVKISLTKGQFAIVDDDDYTELSKHKWHCSYDAHTKSFYAVRTTSYLIGKPKNIKMHRVIMNCPKGMYVDHVNGDTLDNRKQNLRIGTSSQNCQNRKGANRDSFSGIRNVHWHKRQKKWIVELGINYNRAHIGSFDTIEEAERVAIRERTRLMPFSTK